MLKQIKVQIVDGRLTAGALPTTGTWSGVIVVSDDPDVATRAIADCKDWFAKGSEFWA